MRRLLFLFFFALITICGWAQAPVISTDYVVKFFDMSGTLGSSLLFDNGTFVGIGTTSPQAPFHVVGSPAPSMFVDVYSGGSGTALTALPMVYRAARGTAAPGNASAVQTDDILGGLAVRGWGTTGFSSGRGQVMFRASQPWTDTANGTYLVFTTTPNNGNIWLERMRIDNAGNVGIGTTTPGALLEVAGAALIDGPVTVSGQIQSTSGGFRFPDGTLQTTAGLVVTSPLTGSGTASNPLGLNLSVTPPLSGGINGTPLALTGTVGPMNGGTGLSYVGNGFLRGNGGSLYYSPIGSADLPSGVYVDLVSPQMISGNKTFNSQTYFNSQATFNVGTNFSNALQAEADATGAFAIQGQTNATDSQAAGVVGNAMFSGTSSARGVLGFAAGSSGSGVFGSATGTNGVGVAGSASGSGNPVGVSGFVNSSSGAGGVFQNSAQGGDILRANYNGGTIFRIGTNSSGRPSASLSPLGQPGTGSGGGVSSTMLTFSAAVLDNTTNCSGSPCTQNPKFGWRADPINNNAAGFSAQLALYSGVGSSNSNPTGLSINSNGIITFAPGQTFSAGAGLTGVTAGTGLTGGGTSGNVTLSADFTKVQPLLTGLTTAASCGTNQFVTTINSNGTVTCGTTGTVTPGALILSSGGQVTGPVTIAPPTTGASSIYAVNAVQNQVGASMPGNGGGGGPTAQWIASVPAAVIGTATDQSGNVAAGVVGVGTGPGDLAMVATSVGALPTMFVWNQNTSATGGNDANPTAVNAQTSAGVGQVIDAEAMAAAGTDPTCSNCSELTVISAQADATSGTVNLFSGEANSPYANGIQLQFDTPLTTNCPQGTQCPSVFDARDSNNNNNYFNIDGGYNVSTTGNLSANGSATINGSLTVNGGINGTLNNLNINNLNLANATITNLTVPGGISTNYIGNIGGGSNTLTIQAGNTSFGGGVSIPSGMLTVSGTGSFGGPLSANNGLNVSGGGGLTINNGGLTVAGGASLQNGLLVNGALSVTGVKNFKIDDPVDPANKYLYHASIESSEMMNLYSGTIALDKRGNAWVQLPDWFEALNKDFRYQLTAIGAPGPNLYIAKEISGNRFRIAGGKAGMKVSWQVTGVRHDEWANAHRMQVEVEKTGKERGTYLHPELFPEKTALAQKK